MYIGPKPDLLQHEAQAIMSGRLEMVNDDWIFTGLTGRNDSARISCEGQWQHQRDGGWLSLHLEGIDIPLEDELRDAVDPSARNIWQQLRPRGLLDHVAANFELAPAVRHKRLTLQLRKDRARGRSMARR